ncbi:thiolase family protein [Cupriavidus necator]|uniref:thiolase family protein n=1 Tax=Cupriavidus necator TaxID=106590 RepID=UPI0039C47E26
MSNIYIAGIAMTIFGRHFDMSIEGLAGAALRGALQDAGCSADAIGAAFYAGITNGQLQGQLSIPGQVVFSKVGIEGIPVFNVENACASGSTAVHLAVQHLRAGSCDVALALGAEKMNVADKSRSFALFDAGWDVSRVEENFATLAKLGEGIEPPPGSESDRPYSRFMKIYAALCRYHMKTYGTTQRQIAAISAKNHGHSVHNPHSQFRQAFTVEEVLAAPPITYPITLPMCAPVSDGAAAAILCTEEGLRRIGADRSRCIRIAASVIRSFSHRRIDEPEKNIGRLAALQAYEQAGLGPEDMDVAEVHDASAMGEIIQAENLGLVPLGEGGPAAERGEFTLGGRIPINTSGGLESKGHPLGATGIGQLYELVTQLRGEAGARQVGGARHAIQENGGGLQGVEEAALAIHILSKE